MLESGRGHSCTCNVVHEMQISALRKRKTGRLSIRNLSREGERPPRLVGRMNARAGYRHLSLPMLGLSSVSPTGIGSSPPAGMKTSITKT